MSIEHSYPVSVRWENNRMGIMNTPDAAETVNVATPPQFPAGMAGIWSPEHLFTAAINSCLMTTFLSIAEASKLSFVSFNSDAEGKLEQVDGKYIMSEVTLRPTVRIATEADFSKAERILQKAEQNCLISNSVKSKIIFQPTVTVLNPIPA